MLTKEPYEGSQSSTTLLASNSENTEQHPEVDIAPITGARKIKSMQVQPELWHEVCWQKFLFSRFYCIMEFDDDEMS